MLRHAPRLTAFLLVGPVLFGMAATLAPAFDFFPALGSHRLSLDPWRELFAQPALLRSALLSFASGILTALFSLAIVAIFVAGWSHTRAFRLLQHLVSPLLSVPHAAAAFGLAFLFAPAGWLMRLFSPWLTGFGQPPDWLIIHDTLGIAMMAGLVIKEIPFLFLVTLAALPQAKAGEHARIANSLGYGRIAGFVHGVWPLVYRQIRLAVFAVIAYASSVVDVAVILGPTTPAPLAVRLVGWMNDPDLSMRFMASAGAVLQFGVTVAALWLWIIGEKVLALYARTLRHGGHRFANDSLARSISAASVLAMVAIVFTGLFLLAVWSVAGYWSFPDALPRSFTLRVWERQAGSLARPLLITVTTALVSTIAALALTLACLERETRSGKSGGSRALFLIYLPLIVPQASFVFGLQLFFLSLGIDGSFPALVLVHFIFVLPYVFLSLSDPWRAFDTRYLWIASTLGASRSRAFWKIRLPMLLRPVLIAFAVGFAVSIGQYLPTVLIGAGRWPTITTEAVALASGGDRRVIGIYALIQMLLPLAGFALATIVPASIFLRRRDMRAGT
ncbi:MAG: ABC transporter permease subunit [Nitratireductor sp.]